MNKYSFSRVAVNAIIIKKGKVLMGIRKGKGIQGAETWAFPCGQVEIWETLTSALKREVFEETGLRILKPKFVGTTEDFFKKEKRHFVSFFYLIRDFSGKLENKEKDRCYGWTWVSRKKLPKPLFQTVKNLIKTRFKI